ncbi:alpha/beta fold hydrolase [Pseudomonas viridiflava]|uniref:alpha/beta fold hydrolase n=1 Tax=Pseudomonas viridiflava TaxID=33069 RepID=UPI000F036B10|nr:alpha/beta fold hydrolase [Pseudomonas viridiflava]
MQRSALRPATGLMFLFCLASSLHAAPLPAAKEGDWVAPEFTFHTGEKLANLKLHYITLGDPKNPAILFLHGTYRPGNDILAKDFGGELFGEGQPLSASKYYIISTDGIGMGHSTKPSDGLRASFPEYNYADMVQAQYRLVTEGLGIKHLRLIIGNSMGGMQTWMWGQTWPQMMDALVPMASQPTPMSSRNWMMRRLLVESIKQDPAWNNGNYTAQPPSLRLANAMFSIGTSGGNLAYQAAAPSRALADKYVDDRLNSPQTSDANDFIYQWQSSADYDASKGLNKIQAPVLAINAADDERNPPETGLLEGSLREIRNARLLLIPASAETRGHGTTSNAKFYSKELEQFMRETEKPKLATH